MSRVKNNGNSMRGEPSHNADYTKSWRDDEIDLVDLWIVLWAYRKLFFSALILVAVIGVLCFELFYNSMPTSRVRSIIEIESIISDGERIPVVDPDVLIKRIEYIMLPRFSSLSEFEQIKHQINTTKAARISKDSQIVDIVSKLPTGKVADATRFHDLLVEDILLELRKSKVFLTAGVQDTLLSVKSRIANLQGFVIDLEQGALEAGSSQVASNQSSKDENALRKASIQSEIEILTERIKFLELTLSNTESLVLLKAGVLGNSYRLDKAGAYSLILMLSLLLALFLTMGVIFARKVKDRMADEG